MVHYIITYCITFHTVMGTFIDCENYKSFTDIKKTMLYNDSLMRVKDINNIKTYKVELVGEIKEYKYKDK